MISKTFAVLLASVTLCSCGADTEEGVDDKLQDSQTHWLTTCDTDAECGELECSCGVCVASCASDANCSGLGSSAECKAADSEAVSALCGSDYTQSLCLAGCDNDDACDDGQRCVAGSCVVSAEGDDVPSAESMSSSSEVESEPSESSEGNGGASSNPGAGGSSTAPEGSGTGSGTSGAGSGTAGAGSSTGGTNSSAGGTSSTGGANSSNGGAASANGGAGNDDYTLSLNGDQAEVPESYTACTTDADCMLVGDSCSGCCTLVAINSELEDIFNDNLRTACLDYEGGICDCELPDLAPSCVESRCVALPTETEECMSIDYLDLGDFSRTDCPVAEMDLCREGDSGADVFTQECALPWTEEAACPARPASSETMLVLAPFSIGCEPSLQIEQVVECGDRVEVSATSFAPCSDCDGIQLMYRALELPASDKPVVVTQTTVDPSTCNPQSDEQRRRELCETTNGVWYESSCGDYRCGEPPACAAIIPGCDCGAGRNFSDEGCAADAMCLEQ